MFRRIPTALLCLLLIASCGGNSTERASTHQPPVQGAATTQGSDVLTITLDTPPAEPEHDARAMIVVEFRGFDAEGHPVMVLTNLTGRTIDNIRGGLHIDDVDGNYVFATGYTDAISGQVFLEADGTREFHPEGLDRKADALAMLRDHPTDLRFYFQVRDVTYADGETESFVSE